MNAIPPKERAELAREAGINDQYLYQCLSGRRDMDATEAVRVERVTCQRIRRWDLRRDWHLTWPELVGQPGAPSIPDAEVLPRVESA
jgi:DNA-binding transcriptional regulator YdaS (Cro superfamily)